MFMHNFIKIFKKFQEIGQFHCLSASEPRQRFGQSQMTFDNLQTLGLYLVNINVYAKFHHNSPLSLAIFTFSEFGAR